MRLVATFVITFGPLVVGAPPILAFSTIAFLHRRVEAVTATRVLVYSSDNMESNNEPKRDSETSFGATSIQKPSTLISMIGKTTSTVVSGTFFATLAWYRDAFMVSFFIGAISNGILSKVLKKVIDQSRPEQLQHQESVGLKPSDGGMPSSHAMSLGFIGTFTALQLPWATVPLAIYALISLVFRVQSNLHTWPQIGVGAVVGSTNGYLWRQLCFGSNPWKISIMDMVSSYFLNDQGVLPVYMLALPAFLGLVVVGSFERRIARYLKQKSS